MDLRALSRLGFYNSLINLRYKGISIRSMF